MQLIEHAKLDHLNTMRLPCTARFLACVSTEDQLQQVLRSVLARRLPLWVLGGGSNVLLPPHLEAVVIRPALRGVRVWAQHGDDVIVEAMAGEPWHPFVLYTLQQGWYGLENLSLIAGTVGACPIQNVGAYGVEVADRLHSLVAMDQHTGELRTFWPHECAFAYRDSVFKQQPNRWIITRVRFALSRRAQLVLGYGDVTALAGRYPTPTSVSRAICQIRASKLPDPAVIPNTGSFFKNPVVDAAQYATLKQRYPQLGGYVQPDGQIKLAAGWLIDQAGWRGRPLGPVSMYAKQALVLVNLQRGQLADVYALSDAVCDAVQHQFGVVLSREPVDVQTIFNPVTGECA